MGNQWIGCENSQFMLNGAVGNESVPSEYLSIISQPDTALRNTSLVGSLKIFRFSGESASSSVTTQAIATIGSGSLPHPLIESWKPNSILKVEEGIG